MTVSARAILAYLQLAPSNHEDWKEVASVRHRRVQQMPSKGREFSRRLVDRTLRMELARQRVKIILDKKKHVIQTHAPLFNKHTPIFM